jgi:Na+-translocating ferredoxin:NAD+ oxidoreductase subunit B
VSYWISEECVGCGLCRRSCPWDAVVGVQKQRHQVEPALCRECGTCWHSCPKAAVTDPAGFVRDRKEKARLPKAVISKAACRGCQNCLLTCEQGAISFVAGKMLGHCEVDPSRCIGCAACLQGCLSGCIAVT